MALLVLRGRQTRLTSLWESRNSTSLGRSPTHTCCELPDVGHFAPLLAPELLAEELNAFFQSVRQPA